jgi:hypothetical protein
MMVFPDVLFKDIQLPGLTSLEVEALKDKKK